jgi:hypothetical protein
MHNEAAMNHFSTEILADYLDLNLSEDEELQIEDHLALCRDCTSTVRQQRALTEVLAGWTARAHGQAHLAAAVERALTQVEVQNPAWRTRLASWAERWAGAAEAAVRVVLAAPGSASRIVTEGLDALARPGAAFQFAPVPAAIPTRGPRGRGAGPPRAALAVASANGTSLARIAVGGEQREVVVRLDTLPAGAQPPLVLLAPIAGPGEPRVALPERQPGLPYWIARFDDLPPGEYLVAFEPSA